MAYHIYTTKGIVLGARPLREADRIYSIFTEELGLVHARATGVRAIQSKLRGSLEPFSLSVVSLIRGKEVWRITGGTLIERLGVDEVGKDGVKTLGRIFSLLEKLVAGEEMHMDLFKVLDNSLRYIYEEKREANEIFEILLVEKLLNELGYISSNDVPNIYNTEPITENLIRLAKKDKRKLLDAINLGLRSSHLV